MLTNPRHTAQGLSKPVHFYSLLIGHTSGLKCCLSVRVPPDEIVAAPTIRDTSFIVRFQFNVPAAPRLRL